MSKLSDAQLVLLSAASQRNDRIVAQPPDTADRAAAKFIKPLLKHRLLEEVPAVNGYPVFRRDRVGDALALRITDEGLTAIGVDLTERNRSVAQDRGRQAAATKGRKPPQKRKPSGTKVPSKMVPGRGSQARGSSLSAPGGASQSGSKQAILIAMLQKKQGAAIDAIVSATGWLPHTARAMISGLRKLGYKVELERKENAKSVYRIVGGPKRSSARKMV